MTELPTSGQTAAPAPHDPAQFFESYLPGWFGEARAGNVTSPGPLVFRVGERAWSLKLVAGALSVTPEAETDALLTITLSLDDFATLVSRGGALFGIKAPNEVLALRSLELDAERASLLRNVDGSVLFELSDGDLARQILLTPSGAKSGAAPACTLRASAEDFWALTRGEKSPFELLMEGKVRITGRAELAMALSSVLMPA